MNTTPRQPTRDERLFDSLHGLNDGEDNESEVLKPEYFLNSLTYDYFKSLQPKQRDLWLERQFRKAMSQSLWPRILIARCRLLVSHALPLLSNGSCLIMDVILNTLRILLQYLSILLHGLRLLINLASLVIPRYAESSGWNGVQSTFSDSWFELFLDTHSLTMTFLPTTYIKSSLVFSLIELGLFLFKGWLELSKLAEFKLAFKEQSVHAELPQARELQQTAAHASALYSHQCQKLILNLAILSLSLLMTLVKSFLLPALSLALVSNPVTPFIFSLVALSLSLANHYLGSYIDEGKPPIKISQLSDKCSFFKANAPALLPAQHADELPLQSLAVPSLKSASTLYLS
ncbi:MAG: hypothetical protein ACRC0M_07380 [Legionella sp.]